MRIIWFEMRKVLTSPVFLILFLLMVVFNIYVTISEGGDRKELSIVNEIIDTYGLSYNDDTLKTMEKDITKEVQALGGTNRDEFIKNLTYEQIDELPLEQQKAFKRVASMNGYYNNAVWKTVAYEDISIQKMKNAFLEEEGIISPWLHDRMVKEYDKLSNRFDEIISTGEHKTWFFNTGRMHWKLFKETFIRLNYEGVLIIVLLTAFIMNYEFEHRTQLTVFSMKKGRKLIFHKGIASLLTSLIVIIALYGLSLGTYFLVYDYSHVWGASISSVFNWDVNIPYFSWFPMTIAQYLVIVLVVMTILLLLVSFLTFGLSIFIKNSYFTWILTVCLIAATFIFTPSLSILRWIAHYNISLLILNPHYYFIASNTFLISPYNIIWTFIGYFGIFLFISFFAIKSFNRKDVN